MTTPGSRPERAFESFSARHRRALDLSLSTSVPADASPLSRAMRAALAGGKRIRAFVAIACGEIFRGDPEVLIRFGGAVEAVHAASLILDDLPSMDDATLRRGAPAVHLEFGEATAILAAVALFGRSFEVVAGIPKLAPATRARLVDELARAAGEPGSCRGQQADLDSDPSTASLDELERIHALKTGALFVAAARGGAIAARASEEEIDAVGRYAKNLGLAFQIVDDLLEEAGDSETTGKKAHRDGHRANFARILGAATARTIVQDLTSAAVASVGVFGARGEALADLARYLAERTA